METTKLSSKGQVIIPKSLRNIRRWEVGLEFTVIDTAEGVLLKPKAPFAKTILSEVAGMLKTRIRPKTDAQIKSALKRDAQNNWRGRS